MEGTRFTQAKLLAAQEYAASAGLPVPQNVLIPRTKVMLFLNYARINMSSFYLVLKLVIISQLVVDLGHFSLCGCM